MVFHYNNRGVFRHRSKNIRGAKFELGDSKDLFVPNPLVT